LNLGGDVRAGIAVQGGAAAGEVSGRAELLAERLTDPSSRAD
jgi:hypothetical protein